MGTRLSCVLYFGLNCSRSCSSLFSRRLCRYRFFFLSMFFQGVCRMRICGGTGWLSNNRAPRKTRPGCGSRFRQLYPSTSVFCSSFPPPYSCTLHIQYRVLEISMDGQKRYVSCRLRPKEGFYSRAQSPGNHTIYVKIAGLHMPPMCLLFQDYNTARGPGGRVYCCRGRLSRDRTSSAAERYLLAAELDLE